MKAQYVGEVARGVRRQRVARPVAAPGLGRHRLPAPPRARPLPRAQSALGRRTAFACVHVHRSDTNTSSKINRFETHNRIVPLLLSQKSVNEYLVFFLFESYESR